MVATLLWDAPAPEPALAARAAGLPPHGPVRALPVVVPELRRAA